MSQCLHCGKPSAEGAVFCQECQTRSDNAFLLASTNTPQLEDEASPFATIPLSGSEHNTAEQALAGLNAAASWMDGEEKGGRKRLRRSSRLSPLRDISAEIHRTSTPHPRTLARSGFETQPDTHADSSQKTQVAEEPGDSKKLAKIWSWLSKDLEEDEEKDGNPWLNATDPLLARARPTAGDAELIEAEDIRRAQFENQTTLPYPGIGRRTHRRRRQSSLWYMAFVALVVVAVVALAVDGLLLSFAFINHAKHPSLAGGGPPTLTLSENVANVGATIEVQLTNFAPTTRVALTHDIQETLTTTGHATVLTINENGQASASFVVSKTWTPGSHLIVAEDITTRDTASALLQISGEGPSRPPHLLLDSPVLDLGEGVQGTSTLQPLALHNAGSGSITWSVSSNQPWLLVAPQQGTFGIGQTLEVAAQRSNLHPGKYSGTLTLSSNVGQPEQLTVMMRVNALPPDAGSMISLSPPLLSFTTMDGFSSPASQVVTLSNPGQQVLHWSLSGRNVTTPLQSADQQTPADNASWMNAEPTSGLLASGQSVQIHVAVNSTNLLPGAYLGMFTFQGPEAYDTPQVEGVALTVEPHCGLVTGTGMLTFTAVAGQSNPSPHVLSLNATSSCAGEALSWQALHTANWLTVSPTSGQVKGTNSSFTSIGVNTAGLTPGEYTSQVTFQTGQSTQTVTVELTLQPQPPPSVPILGALPLSLNFSAIQGQADPTAQIVTVTNNGGSTLKWHTSVNALGSGWLSATPSGGTVEPGQTGQVTVNVMPGSLTPGTYAGQLTLVGTDAKGAAAWGNPQTITVNLIVQPPCTLSQPSASSLLFNGIASGANPLAQTETLTGSGSCVWPLHWSASNTSGASWLLLSPASGTLNSVSQQGVIQVGVNTSGLQPGTYNAQVAISASDSAHMVATNTPQSFTVTLTVLQPCTLQPLPASLTFNASQGQATSPSQTLNLSETGSCGSGVAWTATGDSNSSSWLGLSATSGTNNGSGSSIVVTITPGNMPPGNYTGQITVSASSNGIVLKGSPQTVNVTFTVTGYKISGTVLACGGPSPNCSTSQGLANATVTLISSSNATVGTIIADSAGNFTFANIPLGNYTLSVSGSTGTASYGGTLSVTVNGDTTGLSVQTFSS